MNEQLDMYLPSFFLSFVVALGVGGAIVFSLKHFRFSVVRRWGGLVMVASFLVAVFFDRHLVIDEKLWWVVWVLLSILIFGLIDDRCKLSWKMQLFFQVAVATILFFGGVAIQSIGLPFGGAWFLHPELSWWPALPLSIVWLLLIVNAVNWSDGVDGVAGSVTLVGFLTIFVLSLRPEVNQPPTAILALAAAGATLGFLVFNFPQARFIAGTSGSYFWGFLLGILAIFAGTKIATTLLVLALPVADAVWVIGERWQSGVSIFHGDSQRHLHFKLRQLGWSDRKISSLYAFVAVVLAVFALTLHSAGKLLLLAGTILAVMTMYLLLKKRLVVNQ